MSTLNDHVILYDADCPLCKAYTGAFVKNRMLDRNGRQPYGNMPAAICEHVDTDRARNEIALVNTRTGEAIYGMDSLFTIIGNTAPVFRPLFRNAAFRWCISRLYKLVSYNRKMIAAVKPSGPVSCTPDFNLKYRLLYLLMAILITGGILSAYSALLGDMVPAGSYVREYMICAGQLIVQGAVLLLVRKEKLMDYLGNMMTVSLIGGLLLLPALAVHRFAPGMNAAFYPAWFFVVVCFMFIEHTRRTRLLGLNMIPGITWILYRVAVLALLIY